ncbi:MAG: PA2169 family four-helix-bundle protein [Pyrinomonadaceae bacterium]
MDNDTAISTLNNLIETCKDGENGFSTAAEGTKNAELKTLFTTYSQQRAQFATELQGAVRGLGGDPEKTGSVVASLHRGWINIKSAVTGESDAAIIAECESGEDSAKANYEEAMKENLPANVKSIVERQYGMVKEAHDRVRDLKRATS